MMSGPWKIGCVLPLLGLVSCAVGPDFREPEVALPRSFSKDGMIWKRQSPRELPDSGAWWKVYRDSALSSLVERSLANNQQLEAAAARLDEARSLSKATRSLYFPNIQMEAGARRTKSVFRGPSGGSIYYSSYTVPLELNYELDVWGKVRRQVEGAKANEAAEAETLRAMQLSVAGEVAQTYWALRAVDADRELMRRTLEIRRKALELITAKERAGEISGLDLSRARSEVAAAEADRLRLDQQRAELVHALAVLNGEMAPGESLSDNGKLPEPPSIPAALPSEVVFQRPDVRASLQRVAAANADIGVSTAAMYPSFSINASTGVDANQLNVLTDIDAMVWSLGSNLVMPLSAQRLLGFRRDAAVASHRAATADYRQVVIESVAEIENALQAAAILERRQQAQEEALQAVQETFDRSLKRFDSGLVSFLDVVDAERTLLSTGRQANAIRAEALALSVSLIKALGGRW